MNIKEELTKGISVTFVSKYSNVLIQLILGIVLARLLSPEEFGIVAIMTIFTNFFHLLATGGINSAVVQEKNLNDEHNSIIFNYTIIIGFFLSFIFYMSSLLIAKFYDNSIYIEFGKILTISIIFFSISSVPLAIITKKREFKKAAVINISTNIFSGIIAIILAYLNFSYYALIIQVVIKSILQFFISYYYSKIIFIFKLNLEPLKLIFKYAGFDFMFKFLNYFSRNSDNIIIGKFLGATTLGYYDKAYRFMLYPVQMLTQVITPVLHPVLAHFQDDKKIIFNTYNKVVEVLAVIGIPISVILFYSSNEVILILFGEQWIESIPSFRILSTTIWIQMILSSSGSIFRASGRTDLLFLSGILSSVTTITGIFVGVLYFKNLEALSMILVAAFSINFLQAYWLMYFYIFEKSLKELIIVLKKPILIGVIMALFLYFFELNITNIYISMFYKTVLGITIFIISCVLLKETYINLIISKIIKKLRW